LCVCVCVYEDFVCVFFSFRRCRCCRRPTRGRACGLWRLFVCVCVCVCTCSIGFSGYVCMCVCVYV
jgi:hypothetical protein